MEEVRLLERILDEKEKPRDLSLALLQRITNNFSKDRKIGHDGFGEVYKGVLGEERIVAVKRNHINKHTLDDKLFRREFNSVTMTNHRNVVRFLGFCSAEYKKQIEEVGSGKKFWASVLERLFCFEYMDSGNLQNHITDELRGLEWETRYEIITEICNGLCYLHEKGIIHMDLKPTNILLQHDEKHMVPKITGFAMSRPNKNTYTLDQCYGTLGYWAPENRESGRITPACDIYSLGLIIIEIVTGCTDVPDENNVLRRWKHRWNKPPTRLQYQQITRCIYIAKRCRETKLEARPSISEIINFLSKSESTHKQIRPCFDEDDMLRIKPLELWLPFEVKNEISWKVELRNDTQNYFTAFNIQLPTSRYSAQPIRGIVQPRSMYVVTIKVKGQDVIQHDYADKIIVQSMHVEASEDITELMFRPEARKVIDEVDLMVVYESKKPQENSKSREETNMPAEEVHKFNQGEASSSTHTKDYLSYIGLMEMPFQELDRMTDGFSEKLLIGRGGYGKVYKVVLDDGKVIAVKKLNFHPGLAEDGFKNELHNLMRVQHKNIIRLVGYCSEKREKVVKHEGEFVVAVEQHRALCLEYMPGGTLEKLISDESCELPWEARYKIIKGVCQGLKHLHTGSKDPIYHLDLKPSNILLDKDGIPKLGDFGLSRLLESMDTFSTKTSSGTLAYTPPEYAFGLISPKFDVFSLGIIIVRIVAGRDGYYEYKCRYTSAQEFIGHVTRKWFKRVQANTSKETLPEIQKCIEIALRCVNVDRVNRPTITEIVEELNIYD